MKNTVYFARSTVVMVILIQKGCHVVQLSERITHLFYFFCFCIHLFKRAIVIGLERFRFQRIFMGALSARKKSVSNRDARYIYSI